MQAWWKKNDTIFQNNEQTSHENEEEELTQLVQMNICHSKTYKSTCKTVDISMIG